MRRANGYIGWVLAGALSLVTGHTALACAFHGYTPNPTLVDRLLQTEQVVLARLTRSNRYEPVETLLGPPVTDIAIPPTPPIRKELQATDPSAPVLLARDGAYGPWVELAVLDPEFRKLVDQVLHHQSAWLLGRETTRVALFAAHVTHTNPRIRRLALQELDRLPYATLKDIDLPVIPSLEQDLAKGEADLRPIRILLAGLSRDGRYSPVLQSGLSLAIQQDVPHLGAYATALIELNGTSAVHEVVAPLGSTPLPAGTQEKLLQALALQYKTARGPTRRTIAREIARLVRDHPDLSDIVIRQFGPKTSGRLLR